MASMCPHLDINEYYRVRHNAAGKELTKGIRNGKLGRLMADHNKLRQGGWTGGPGDYTHLDVVGRGQE
jgi:hypothetical protein